MIIHSRVKLQVGDTVTGMLLSPQNVDHIVTFAVMREATLGELIEYLLESDMPYNPAYVTGKYFYEISMD